MITQTNTGNSDEPTKTANELLAELVVERLSEGGLIAAGRKEEVLKKLVAGTATEDDWHLWIELGPAAVSGSQDAQS